MKIKFRAWDERNKVMHYDFQFIQTGNEGNDWIIFISDKFPLSNNETNPFENPNPYFSQQLKKMQYIGIRDKNDTDIYNGDIVIAINKSHNKDIPNKWTGEVKYGRNNGCWGLNRKIDVSLFQDNSATTNHNIPIFNFINFGCGIVPDSELEIIGNIYENPELLSYN